MTSLERIKEMLAKPSEEQDITWLFSGDSITQAAAYLHNHRDYTELFQERIRYELCRYHDAVIRTGISGWTTKLILGDIERRILKYKPDVLSMMIGMNDSGTTNNIPTEKFRENYNSILDQAADCSNPALILHTTNPIWDVAKDIRGELPKYNQVIREIAAERQAVLVDHEKYWQEMIEKNVRRATLWMADSIHPDHYGHVAFAHTLFKALEIWDDDSGMCRIYKP